MMVYLTGVLLLALVLISAARIFTVYLYWSHQRAISRFEQHVLLAEAKRYAQRLSGSLAEDVQ